jgi:hypothetical protein
MKKTVRATDFLHNMTESEQPAAQVAADERSIHKKAGRSDTARTREGLKHIGGYLTTDAVEKVAILRARLGLDNSELITLAVNELHAKHQAKRAFGDI